MDRRPLHLHVKGTTLRLNGGVSYNVVESYAVVTRHVNHARQAMRSWHGPLGSLVEFHEPTQHTYRRAGTDVRGTSFDYSKKGRAISVAVDQIVSIEPHGEWQEQRAW